ncbi:hypothetical protein BS78_01G227500 [Paspalum vaginatum]|nr:hypothetical protein BS78_01G227500 [Paspalum vaginatum]
MGDSVQVACVIPDAADTEFQIHCLKRSAYAAVLRAFCAQSDLLSRAKEGCLAALRNELGILEIEHKECLGKARSNKQINSLRAGLHSNGSICSTELRKDTPGLACALPDSVDTVLQIHCLEQSAYSSVLRAFCAVTNRLSRLQVILLTRLRNELRISHVEHTEAFVKINSNENIKTLRKYSLANLSVLTKTNPEYDAHAVLHDKIGSPGQSPIPEHSMSSTRDIVISDSSNGAKEGPNFEPHAVVSAKRLKSVDGHALAYLKCAPSDLLPVVASMVMVKDHTDVTLERETLSYEMNSGCSASPIVQENHSQLNAGQVSSCVDHARKESGKRKTEVPGMRVSPSLGVMDINCGIKCQRSKSRNKGSDLEHGSEVISLRLTANLLRKVERLLRENQDAANLEKAKSIIKAQEKDLLGALFKLSGVSYDVTNFSANGQPGNINTHDDDKGDEGGDAAKAGEFERRDAAWGDEAGRRRLRRKRVQHPGRCFPLSGDPNRRHRQLVPGHVAPPRPAAARAGGPARPHVPFFSPRRADRVFARPLHCAPAPRAADGRGVGLRAPGAEQEAAPHQVHGGASGCGSSRTAPGGESARPTITISTPSAPRSASSGSS